jgi:GTPase SAR1 family protein
MESVSTGISLVGTLYEQKGPIKELLDKLSAKWRGKKHRLIVTGMAGVGKTTLVDCLSGRVFSQEYRLPGRSIKVEHTNTIVPSDPLRDESKKRLLYSVIPGQVSSVRQSAFNDLLAYKSEITGVIHVVASGLAEMNDRRLLDGLKEQGITTMEAYKQFQMNRELADLENTCAELERYMVANRRPIWFVLAVNKIDLFHQTLNDDIYVYAKNDHLFFQRLTTLQNRVGSLFFQWDIVPVCSWLEDFEFNGQVLPSTLKPTQFREYLTDFMSLLIRKL